MDRWNGNLLEINILFRYLKMFLLHDLMSNLQTFQNINISDKTLKHVIWRLPIQHYFREIFQFRNSLNALISRNILFP